MFRKKGPFTGTIGDLIYKVVNHLEPEVGHTYVIGIGIDKGNSNSPFPGFPNCPLLLFKEAIYLFP
jgi:hypothetical protein